MTETTASPDGTLERTPDGAVIHFERHLPYPIDAVWDAITTPERLGDWWLPFEADITIESLEGPHEAVVETILEKLEEFRAQHAGPEQARHEQGHREND